MPTNRELLSSSIIRRISRSLIDFINNNCPLFVNGDLFMNYQALDSITGISLQDLPNGIKLKEYLDGKSFVGQYNFAIYYRVFNGDDNQRHTAMEVLDSIAEFIENADIDPNIEGVVIYNVSQNQSAVVYSNNEDGTSTYVTTMSLRFDYINN